MASSSSSENPSSTTTEEKSPFVLYEKNGQPVFVPPELADLFRDLPPEPPFQAQEEEEGDPFHEENEFLGAINNNVLHRTGHNASEGLGNGMDDMEDGLRGIQVVGGDQRGPDDEEDEADILWNEVRNNCVKLIPYFMSSFLYFALHMPEQEPSWTGVLAKCFPILSLAAFVALSGYPRTSSAGTLPSSTKDEDENKRTKDYNRRILAALLFSCLGDLLLVWPNCFLHGMIAFGIAQVCYIRALGMQPLHPNIGIGLYGITGTVLAVMAYKIVSESWPVMIGVFVYSNLLITTFWRAACRMELLDQEGMWSTLCSLMGAFFFTISDLLLAVNRFYIAFPHHQDLIMFTYYSAQFSYALSTVQTPELFADRDN